MASFMLRIVTPDGLMFSGEAQSITVRTVEGDVGILPNHINFLTALGMGEAKIVAGGQTRRAACIGGMLSVRDNEVNLVPTTFEWADRIDVPRAEASEKRAKTVLANKSASDADLRLAEARLKRALVRKSVGSRQF